MRNNAVGWHWNTHNVVKHPYLIKEEEKLLTALNNPLSASENPFTVMIGGFVNIVSIKMSTCNKKIYSHYH